MAKITRTLKVSTELDKWFVTDAEILYGKDTRKVSTHMVSVLEKYMETRGEHK